MIVLCLSGGLGNQLFQYAVALAVQQTLKDEKDEIVIDTSDCSFRPFSLHHFELMQDHPRIVNIREQALIPARVFIRRCIKKIAYIVHKKLGWRAECNLIAFFSYIMQKLGFYICPMKYKNLVKPWSKNKIIYGYFQSPLYFNHLRDTILNKFIVITPPTPNSEKLFQTMATQNAVCVHIRRGDYVSNASVFLICNGKYYLDGMRAICERVKEPTFYIFSDDIEWCKTNIAFEYEVTFVEENNPDYEEMRLMSACKHFVISNSSFSWWAQYLSTAKDKVVVAPSRWFNEDIQMDIWMPGWVIVDIDNNSCEL